ncbi:DnaD and phage-associated domain-containing protein, partial [Alicyclobacillus hesperidum]
NAHESVTLRERNAQVAGLPNQTQHNQTKTLSGGESARAREEISLELNRLLGKSPNPMQVELMAAYSEPGIGMDVELVKRAIRVAALKNKDLNYATAILKKQHERGIQTVAQAEADDASRQAAIASRANEKTPRGTNRTRDKPVDPDPRYANFYALFPEEAK